MELKIKINKISFIYSLFINILSLFYIKCQIKIFPDHISPGDPIFNTSQVYDTTNERFYYSLGYFTDADNDAKIFSKKYGIYYDNVKCTGGTYDAASPAFVGKTKIIEEQLSTVSEGKNFFEEIELFKNVITGSNIECNSNLKVVHDKNLRIKYIIPVISDSTDSNIVFTIHVKNDDGGYDQICNVKLESGVLKMVQIDIKTDIENILEEKVTMSFWCTDAIISTTIRMSGNRYIDFVFNKDSSTPISISNYRITVEDLFSKSGIDYNKELDRSKIGLTTIDSCQESSDCFRGYVCQGGYCRKCHYSCMKCSQQNSLNDCTQCGPLTDDHETYPEYGICPINYIDISQFKDLTVKILPYGKEYHDRATIGLWLFFSDLQYSKSLTNDIYHIISPWR